MNVHLVSHTSCGLEFEFVNPETNDSLTERMFWCTDEDIEEDEEIESRGWERMREYADKRGWTIALEVWS